MMKRVSFSQLKSNLVGRRHSSDSDTNIKSAINSQTEAENCTAKEVSSSSRKDLHRSNNLFRVLKNKWKIKRGTKYSNNSQEECLGGASALSSDIQEFVPKKLRSKISKSNVAKRVVCPLPSQVQCIPLNHESDDTYENASEVGGALNRPLSSGISSKRNKDFMPNPSTLSSVADSSSQQLLPEVELIRGEESTVDNNQSVSSTTGQRAGSLTKELFKLSRCGWYWGPITRSEAEEKLTDQSDGAFLVRDSSDDRYLLSLSFRSCSNTLHTRIEHSNGLFSFYAVQHQPHFSSIGGGISSNNGSSQESEGHSSIVALIEESMNYSQSGVFCYSRGRTPDSPSYPVRLTKPVSRFNQVRTLQYLCRFVIRQHTRVDHIQKLPLPNPIKGYLEESHY